MLPLTSRALRRDPEILVLVEDVVERILVVLGDAEDADHPVPQIATLVEADLSLQGLDMGGLDGVANLVARYLLAGGGDPFDRIENDQRRDVRGGRVIFGLLSVFLDKTRDDRRGIGIFEYVRRRDRGVRSLGGGEAGAAQYLGTIKTVSAALDHSGEDVGGLLDHLDPGLSHAAIV